MIRLWTLGGIDLRDGDGRELRAVLKQPKRLALLLFLALHTPRGFIGRERLLALFWPEHDDEHARAALNRALHYLRVALGPGVVLSRGDDAVSLAWDRFWCDASAFESAADTAEMARESVDLYRGDLLHGFHLSEARRFEEWLDAERERLRRVAHRTAWALAGQEEAAGNGGAAGRWALWASERSPYDEAGLRRLIALLDRVGDRAGAMRAYDEFVRRLKDEFEVEPAPETRALVETIRGRAHENGAPAKGLPAGPEASRPTNDARPLAPQPVMSRPRRRSLALGLAGAVAVAATATAAALISRDLPIDRGLVAVSPIENRTGDATLDSVADRATDWIARTVADAIESRTSPAYASGNRVVRANQLSPGEARPAVRVMGELYRANGGLVYRVRVMDEVRGGSAWTIPEIDARPAFVEPAVRELAQRATGGAVALLDSNMGSWLPAMSTPPRYDALLEVLRATRVQPPWTAGPYYERAATLDTTFTYALLIAAKMLMASNAVKSHEILHDLDHKRGRLPRLQVLLLNSMLATIADDRMANYEALAEAASVAPTRFLRGFAASASALYRPRETLRLLDRVDRLWPKANGLGSWVSRTHLHHQLGEHRTELALALRARRQRPDRLDALYAYVRAKAALGQVPEVMALVDTALMSPRDPYYTPGNIMSVAADELRAHGHPEAAALILRRTIAWYRESPGTELDSTWHTLNLARALSLNREWTDATTSYQQVLAVHPEYRAEILGQLGAIAARSGDRGTALQYLTALEALDVPAEGPRYEALISRARICALLGDAEGALRWLRDAVGGQGMDLHADADFESLANHRAFREFVRPKG